MTANLMESRAWGYIGFRRDGCVHVFRSTPADKSLVFILRELRDPGGGLVLSAEEVARELGIRVEGMDDVV